MDRRRLLKEESWQRQPWPERLDGEERQRRRGSLVLVALLIGALLVAFLLALALGLIP